MRFVKPACVAAVTFTTAAGSALGATSSFDTSAEGWTGAGDTDGPLVWTATGGNPAGHVFIDDITTGGVTYFVAPTAFLGNKGSAYGTALTFDLRQEYSGGANQFNDEDLLLQGNGITLAYDLSGNPANGSWTSYAVTLTETGWRVGNLGGAAATEAQMRSVLSNLTSLRIRAEYQTGPDVGSLDNVALVPEPGAAALFALGGGVLAWRLRQRRRP